MYLFFFLKKYYCIGEWKKIYLKLYIIHFTYNFPHIAKIFINENASMPIFKSRGKWTDESVFKWLTNVDSLNLMSNKSHLTLTPFLLIKLKSEMLLKHLWVTRQERIQKRIQWLVNLMLLNCTSPSKPLQTYSKCSMHLHILKSERPTWHVLETNISVLLRTGGSYSRPACQTPAA